MVFHTCNPSILEAEQEDQKFEVSLGYIAYFIVRPCLKKHTKEPPRTWAGDLA
jgi:hypothetical protein